MSEVPCTLPHCDCAGNAWIRKFQGCGPAGYTGCFVAAEAACELDASCTSFAYSTSVLAFLPFRPLYMCAMGDNRRCVRDRRCAGMAQR